MSVFVLNVRDDEAVYAELARLLQTGALIAVHKVDSFHRDGGKRQSEWASGRRP